MHTHTCTHARTHNSHTCTHTHTHPQARMGNVRTHRRVAKDVFDISELWMRGVCVEEAFEHCLDARDACKLELATHHCQKRWHRRMDRESLKIGRGDKWRRLVRSTSSARVEVLCTCCVGLLKIYVTPIHPCTHTHAHRHTHAHARTCTCTRMHTHTHTHLPCGAC